MNDKHKCITPKLLMDIRKGLIGQNWVCPCGQAWEIRVSYLGPIEGITAKRVKSD